MPNYYQGTIGTLSNIVAQEKQAKLAKETPQYQQALFNLMESKKQAIARATLMEQLQNMNPADIPAFLATQTGDVDPFLTQQKTGEGFQQKRELEVNEAIETFENLQGSDIEHIRQFGSLPKDVLPRIKVRQRSPLVRIGLDKFEAARQTALGSAAGKAETTINSVSAIVGDVTDVFSLFEKIPETFKGNALKGATIGEIGKIAQSDVRSYFGVRELTLANIAKKLGGEVGVLTDRDIERITKSLPNLIDPKETVEAKTKFVYNYMDRRVKAYQKTARLPVIGINMPKKYRDPNFNETKISEWENDGQIPLRGQGVQDTTIAPQDTINPNVDIYLQSLGL